MGPVLLASLLVLHDVPFKSVATWMLYPRQPTWLEEIWKVPVYQARLRELETATEKDAETEREAIGKVLSMVYSYAEASEEGRNILSSFPPEWLAGLQAAAAHYPRVNNYEVTKARTRAASLLS